MKRLWEIPGYKPSTAEFQVSLDLSAWLGTENVEAVTFTAKEVGAGTDVTTSVLDSNKNAYSASIVRPWIKGGESGKTYQVSMAVTTNQTTKDIFVIQFSVYDY